MKFGVIIAARFGSSRLRGKAMLPILGLPTINLVIKRLQASKLVSTIILATTEKAEDDVIVQAGQAEGVEVFRGAENDVLGRYVEAARGKELDYLVRATGDCPFIDGKSMDHVLEQCIALGSFDLVTTKPSYPMGVDYEIYDKHLLEKINEFDLTAEHREHMLNYVYENEQDYQIERLIPPKTLEYSEPIFLLDTAEDYRRIEQLTKGQESIYLSPEELIQIAKTYGT